MKFAQKGEKAPAKRLLARDQEMISPAASISSGSVCAKGKASDALCKEPGAVYTHAHELADAGYAVLPTAIDKRPLTRSGVYDATRDHGLIDIWAAKYPDANLGIACGKASGFLVAVDIDRPELAKLKGRLRLPSTPIVKTGRPGLHLYCSSTKPFKTQTTTWGELRGEGSYVIAPPSRHPSGVMYEWVVPLDFEALLPVEDLAGFLPGVDQALELGLEDLANTKVDQGTVPRSTRFLSVLLEAGEWTAVARSLELAEGFRELFKLPPLGRHFRCLRPECQGASTDHAVLWASPEGVKYRCFSRKHKDGKQGCALSLPGVYAEIIAGRSTLSNIELVTWTKRLVLDTGLIGRPIVALPELPEGLPANRYELREVIQQHFESRAVGVGLEPTPLANDFLAGISGMPKTTVLRAKGDLLKHKVIVKAGTYATKYGKPGTLYLPGRPK